MSDLKPIPTADLNSVLAKLTRIEAALLGNFEQVGLVERVRILERAEQQRQWLIKSMFGTSIAAAGTAIWNLIAMKGGQ